MDWITINGGKLRNATTVLIYLDSVLHKNDGPIRILDKSHVLEHIILIIVIKF